MAGEGRTREVWGGCQEQRLDQRGKTGPSATAQCFKTMLEMQPAHQHGYLSCFYAQLLNYFTFVFPIIGKFQKVKLKRKKIQQHFIAGCIFILNQQH